MEGPEVVIRKNRTKIDIPVDIEKSKKVIAVAQENIESFTKGINQLKQRQFNFRRLIKGDNKYNKAKLQDDIDSANIEIRAFQDKIDNQYGIIKHYHWVIETLEERMREKSCQSSSTMQQM